MQLKTAGMVALRSQGNLRHTLTSSLAVAAVLLAAPAFAQSTVGDPTTEIVVASDDTVGDFTFDAFTQISPVLVGGGGDVLFSASSFSDDVFVAFSGSPSQLARSFPSGEVTILANIGNSTQLANFAVADLQGSIENPFAAFGATGVDGDQLYLGLFETTDELSPQDPLLDLLADELNASAIYDTGNLFSGAIPIISGDNVALLISNVANETTAIPNVFNTTSLVALSTDFGQSYTLVDGLEGSTSLRFDGDGLLFGSMSDQVTSPNSAILDQIVAFDTSTTDVTVSTMIGPGLGDIFFGGYGFFSSTPNATAFGDGVQFLDGRFSLAAGIGVFALDNVEASIDGSPGTDIVTQAIFMEELGAASNTSEALLVVGVNSTTSLGNVRFESVDDLIVAEDGSVYFSGRARDSGTNQELDVSYWRITNPGAGNQQIEAVLAPGTQLATVDGETFTVSGQPTGFTERSLAIDTTLTDGRTQLLSVNHDGRVALYAYVDLGGGNMADALVAQANDGTFYIVTYVGQEVEVGGVTRTVSDFTLQFGSNDLDGFGDGYNRDEQLGYYLLFSDNSYAVALTSLNGEVPAGDITNYLWQGGCGDDEFSTLCQISGEDGSNWVNAEDNNQVADGPPGSDPAPQIATIRGTDVRISVADVSITSLDSDSTLTIENGRTLTLSGSGNFNELVLNDGTVAGTGSVVAETTRITGAGTIGNLETATLEVGADLTASQDITVSQALNWDDGDIGGAGSITASGQAGSLTPVQVNISGNGITLSTDLTVDGGGISFADGSNLVLENGASLTLTGLTNATATNASISGEGNVLIENGAALNTIGTVSIAPDVEVRNGSSGAAVLQLTTSTLTMDNLTFTNTAAGALDDALSVIVVADASSTLRITEQHTLTIDDRVVLSGGTVDVEGMLVITDRAVLANEASLQLSQQSLGGNGLLVNRNGGQLSFAPGSSPITISAPFANISGGLIPGDRDLTFSQSAISAANAPDDLLQMGLQELLDAMVEPAPILPDVGTLLSLDGNHSVFEETLSFEGEAAVFLEGDLSLAALAELRIETDAILNTTIQLPELSPAKVTIGNDAQLAPLSLFVLDGPNAEDLQITGRGPVAISNAHIAGLTADQFTAGSGSVASDANAIASFTAGLSAANRETQGFRDLPGSFADALATFNVNLAAQGLTMTDVVAEDLRLTLTGFSDLDNFTLLGEGSSLRNSGVTRLTGSFEMPDAGTVLANLAGGELYIEGMDQAINLLNVDNAGLLVIAAPGAGTANDVTIADLAQELKTTNAAGSAYDFIVVGEGATLDVVTHNLLDDVSGETTLFGRFDVEGQVTLREGGEAPGISAIAMGTRVVITGDGTINGLTGNGNGLARIEGVFFGDGRFTGDVLNVSGDDAKATFASGISSDLLIIGENASFEVNNPENGQHAIVLDTLEIDGRLDQKSMAASTIDTLTIGEGARLEFSGDLTSTSATFNGTLRILGQDADGPITFTAPTANIGGTGRLFASRAVITDLAMAQSSEATVTDLAFAQADVAGKLTVTRLDDALGVAPVLNLLAGANVTIEEDATLSALSVEEASQFRSSGSLATQSVTDTTVDGDWKFGGDISLAGGLAIGGQGSLRQVSATQANRSIEARDFFVQGTLTAGEVSAFGGNFEVSALDPVSFFENAPIVATTVEVDALFAAQGSITNNAGITINGNGTATGNVLSAGNAAGGASYSGDFASRIFITGGALLGGDLVLGNLAAWNQTGNLVSQGFLRSTNGDFTVDGNAAFSGGQSQDSSAINRSLLTGFVTAESQPDPAITALALAPQRHELDGEFLITGDGSFDGELSLSEGSVLQIGGEGSFGDATIDGQLLIGGDVSAQDFTVNGTAQFANGTFVSLTTGANSAILAQSFAVTDSFTNLGTFQLGDPQAGAGTFSAGSLFQQSGVFTGVGTIDGSLVQQAVDGGLAADELLFSPGFSPGIVTITGDATFTDGMILMEIGGLVPGESHDQVNVGGTLTFGGNATIVVDLLDTGEGSPFLLETGDEVVLFTASDISPDDVEQISFAVLDELPLGYTLVPDLVAGEGGEFLRVLRGFNGSTLSQLGGLDPAQLSMAGALDFLSSAESGVPSAQLFEIAVDLQFADSFGGQAIGLTSLGATQLSALQATTMRSGSYSLDFARHRVDLTSSTVEAAPSRMMADRISAGTSARGSKPDGERMAASAMRSAQAGGGMELLTERGGKLRLVGQAGYHFGSQGSVSGTVGSSQEGWSADVALEFESAGSDLLLGLAASYGEMGSNLSGNLGVVDADSFSVSLYSRYRAGAFSLAGGASYADVGLGSTRRVFGAVASGETSGKVTQGFVKGGVDLFENQGWRFGPQVEFSFHDLAIDGFAEGGAGDLNLLLPEIDRSSTAADLTGQLVRQLGSSTGLSGELVVTAGYRAALHGDEVLPVNTAFTIAPATGFAQPVGPLVSDGPVASALINLQSQQGLRLGIGYRGLWGRNGTQSQSLSAHLTLPF